MKTHKCIRLGSWPSSGGMLSLKELLFMWLHMHTTKFISKLKAFNEAPITTVIPLVPQAKI